MAVVLALTGLGATHPRSTPAAAMQPTSALPSATGGAAPIDPPVTAWSSPASASGSHLERPIVKGSFGPHVVALQERLTDLGFVTGPADGAYGGITQQAVWAYKKLASGATPDSLLHSDAASLVDDATWQAMQSPLDLSPRRPQGAGTTHVEIMLPLQVLVVHVDDRPVLISHISSGDGERWCETLRYDTDEQGRPLAEAVQRAECGISKTPGGVFRVYRKVAGKRTGPLGGMDDPVYFNYGIAIHGAKNVPLERASHGCIRVNTTVADTIAGLVDVGDRVFVWGDDGREPEQYSPAESLPVFNFPDPDAPATSTPAG